MPCVCEREKEQCCCCLCCCCLFPLRICRPPLPSSSASTLNRETEREGEKGPSCQHSSWLSAGACQVARNLCPWSSFIFPIVFHVLSAIPSNRKSKFCCFCRDQKCNAFSRSPESSNYRRPYETQLRLSLYCALACCFDSTILLQLLSCCHTVSLLVDCCRRRRCWCCCCCCSCKGCHQPIS